VAAGPAVPGPLRPRAAPHGGAGLPVRAGRDRLRGRRGPGPAPAAGPSRPSPPHAGPRPHSRSAGAHPGRGRRHPRRLPAPLPAGWRPLPHPLVGAGRDRQTRVRPRPSPAGWGALGEQLGRGLWAMQIGCVPGSRAGDSWARYGRGSVYDPAAAIPAAARYLVDHGARHHLDRALFAYNHSWSYVAKVKQLAHRYARRGGGRR
jgi:hypothetical protein